jgi:hypothetical protein
VYIFESWRDPSGIDTPLPDPHQVCSSYNPANLVHESVGSRDWRVRDGRHVLHYFDTEQDAINGTLVLSTYNRICAVESLAPPDDYPAHIAYA